MGKAGAYLEHDRVAHGERAALEAIEDFKEFALPLSEEEHNPGEPLHDVRCCVLPGWLQFRQGAPFGLPAAQPYP